MKQPYLLVAGLTFLMILVGCKSTAGPCWLHPGTARTQQTRALRYDPYPESNPGSAMIGVRPREFEKPPPETSRARWFLGKWGE